MSGNDGTIRRHHFRVASEGPYAEQTSAFLEDEPSAPVDHV